MKPFQLMTVPERTALRDVVYDMRVNKKMSYANIYQIYPFKYNTLRNFVWRVGRDREKDKTATTAER